MPVKTPDIEMPVYKQEAEQATAPMAQAQPVQQLPPGAGYVSKGGAAAYVANSIIDGWLKGRQLAAVRNMQTAQNELQTSRHAYDVVAQNYKNVAEQKGENSPEAQQARQTAVTVWNQYNQTRAKYAIPDQGDKGGKGGKGQGAGGKIKQGLANFGSQMFGKGGITPHLIAEMAIKSAENNPEGLDLNNEDRAEMQKLELGKAQTKLVGLEVQGAEHSQQVQKEKEQREALERKVHEAGGVDAILAPSSNASPELKQTANRLKFEALDAESPEGKMKMQFYNDVLTGADKNWTPQQRTLAAHFGAATAPVPTTQTANNGHQIQVLLDPQTNQPIPGSKPFDMGPSPAMQQFYAQRSAAQADLKRAVEADPAQYGVTLGQDDKVNKARIAARIAQLQVEQEFGIKTIAELQGLTGFEAQRNNAIIGEVVKASGFTQLEGKSVLDTGKSMITYPGGKPFPVGRDYFRAIFDDYIDGRAEGSGVFSFRPVSKNSRNNPPEIQEAERQYLLNWVRNQMLAGKGKAQNETQINEALKFTALGNPTPQQTQAVPQRYQQLEISQPPPPSGQSAPQGVPAPFQSIAGHTAIPSDQELEGAQP